MRADAPANHAEIVFRVILDRQPAQQHEAAPVLDLSADFLDDGAQRGHLEMLALQPLKADPRRFDAPHRSGDVAQLRRVELDRVIRRRAEFGDRPGVRMPDRCGKDRGRRRVAVLRCARLKDCCHCFRAPAVSQICTGETATSTRPQPFEGHGEIGHGSCLRRRLANAVGSRARVGRPATAVGSSGELSPRRIVCRRRYQRLFP